jgi:glutaredoxin-related protein
LPENKELRSKLFDISNLRGKYPQIFIEEGGEYEFIGDFEVFEGMLENDNLSQTTAEMHGVKTFTAVFTKCMK